MPQIDLFGASKPLPDEADFSEDLIPIIDLGEPESVHEIEKWIETPPLPDDQLHQAAQDILTKIHEQGDTGLLDVLGRESDSPPDTVEALQVTRKYLRQAHENADKAFLNAIRTTIQNISMFHIKQHRESWFIEDEETKVRLGQHIHPIRAVAIMLSQNVQPGLLIMLTIPAKLAGVERIVMVVPPENGVLNPEIAATIYELGLEEVVLLEGAAAMAVLSSGTDRIEPVDKIVGIGNPMALAAKPLVENRVGVHLVDTRREMLILADEHADPAFIAADILAHCEYPDHIKVLLMATSGGLIDMVLDDMQTQFQALDSPQPILAALRERVAAFLIHETGQAIPWINEIAPQFVHLVCDEAIDISRKITTAGTILVGEYTPEALGSVLAGPNRLGPSMTMARFASTLSVDDFLIRTNVVHFTPQKVQELHEATAYLLGYEKLNAHVQALQRRLDAINEELEDLES